MITPNIILDLLALLQSTFFFSVVLEFVNRGISTSFLHIKIFLQS